MRPLIETQGGAFGAGDVNAGDDFVGRDQTVSAKMGDLAAGGDIHIDIREVVIGEVARQVLAGKTSKLEPKTLKVVSEAYPWYVLGWHTYLTMRGMGPDENMPLLMFYDKKWFQTEEFYYMLSKHTLDDGWGFDPYTGSIFHFEHYSMAKAEHKMLQKKWLFVVETINWTIADNSPKKIHRNQYFASNLDLAIALAVKIQINSLECAEDFLCIRPATVDESLKHDKLESHYYGSILDVISENDVDKLPDSE